MEQKRNAVGANLNHFGANLRAGCSQGAHKVLSRGALKRCSQGAFKVLSRGALKVLSRGALKRCSQEVLSRCFQGALKEVLSRGALKGAFKRCSQEVLSRGALKSLSLRGRVSNSGHNPVERNRDSKIRE